MSEGQEAVVIGWAGATVDQARDRRSPAIPIAGNPRRGVALLRRPGRDRLGSAGARASLALWVACWAALGLTCVLDPRLSAGAPGVDALPAFALAAIPAKAATSSPPEPADRQPTQSFAGTYEWIEIDFVRPFGLVPFEAPTRAMTEWRRIVEANRSVPAEARVPMEAIPITLAVPGRTVTAAPEGQPPDGERVQTVMLDDVGTLGDRLTVSAVNSIITELAPEKLSRIDVSASPAIIETAALIRMQLLSLVNDPLRRPRDPRDISGQTRHSIEVLSAVEGGPTVGSLFANGAVELDDATIDQISRAIERTYATGPTPIEVTARPRGPASGDPRVLEFAVAFVGPLVAGGDELGQPMRSQVIDVSGIDVEFLGWATEPGGTATLNMQEFAERVNLPRLSEAFKGRSVKLVRRPDGLLVDWYPDPDGEEVVVPLLVEAGAQYDPPLDLSVAGVQAMLDGVTSAVADAGVLGVRSRPDPTQLDLSRGGADVRVPQDTRLRVNVEVGVLDDVRSIAVNTDAKPDFWIFGGGRKVSSRVDAKEHARIRERFPIEPGNVLLSRPVRDYLDLLSRHPGRRVDAAITPPRSIAPPGAPDATDATDATAQASAQAVGASGDAAPVAAPRPASGVAAAPIRNERLGNVGVDLLIAENNPLLVFVQGSNTGPSSTGEWRQRFGLIHSQLTGNDDILSLDYITSGFDDTQAATGMYDAPLLGNERLRWRVGGYWSEFRAPDLGFGFEDFLGRSWGVQGELAWNFFQYDKLFLDLVGGVRFFNTRVDNKTIELVGEDDFFVPFVGMRLERKTRESRTVGGFILDLPISSVTANSEEDLVALGTLDPTVNWYKFSWDVEHAFYLEPLFAKPDTDLLLAHEVALRFRGQYSFNGRLIPQEQMVLGGLATVRGYPQSVVAGDTVLVGTAEYRLHVPQLLGVEADPGDLFGRPFRTRPQFAYGTTDWDLIFRGFIDAGVAYTAQPFSFEQDDTLVGAGVGVEFQLFHNFNVRVDWGFALREVPGQVNSGSNRLYFVGTLTF